jgi:hypothetical protein
MATSTSTHYACVQLTTGAPTAQLTTVPGVLSTIVAKLSGNWELYDSATGSTSDPLLLYPAGGSGYGVQQFDLDVKFKNGLYLITNNPTEPPITLTWSE